MLRVRPGVLLVRASFAPTSTLIKLDFPTFDRPRKAISARRGWEVRQVTSRQHKARQHAHTDSSQCLGWERQAPEKNKFAERKSAPSTGQRSQPKCSNMPARGALKM